MVKLLYKPFALLISVLGGLAAGAVFKQVWKVIANEDDTPDATDPERSWREIAIAAAVQGAVFGGIRAIVDRAGAKGFQKATGSWPE